VGLKEGSESGCVGRGRLGNVSGYRAEAGVCFLAIAKAGESSVVLMGWDDFPSVIVVYAEVLAQQRYSCIALCVYGGQAKCWA